MAIFPRFCLLQVTTLDHGAKFDFFVQLSWSNLTGSCVENDPRFDPLEKKAKMR